MRAVLRTAAVGGEPLGDLVPVVTIEIAKPPETAGPLRIVGDVGVEIVTHDEQALRPAHRLVESFHRRRLAHDHGRRDPEQRAVLRGDDHPPLRVDRHRGPRTLPRLGGMDQLDLETLGNLDVVDRGRLAFGEGIRPGAARGRGGAEVDRRRLQRFTRRRQHRPGGTRNQHRVAVGMFDRHHRDEARRAAVVPTVEDEAMAAGGDARALEPTGVGPVGTSHHLLAVEGDGESIVGRGQDGEPGRALRHLDVDREGRSLTLGRLLAGPDPARLGRVGPHRSDRCFGRRSARGRMDGDGCDEEGECSGHAAIVPRFGRTASPKVSDVDDASRPVPCWACGPGIPRRWRAASGRSRRSCGPPSAGPSPCPAAIRWTSPPSG